MILFITLSAIYTFFIFLIYKISLAIKKENKLLLKYITLDECLQMYEHENKTFVIDNGEITSII